MGNSPASVRRRGQREHFGSLGAEEGPGPVVGMEEQREHFGRPALEDGRPALEEGSDGTVGGEGTKARPRGEGGKPPPGESRPPAARARRGLKTVRPGNDAARPNGHGSRARSNSNNGRSSTNSDNHSSNSNDTRRSNPNNGRSHSSNSHQRPNRTRLPPWDCASGDVAFLEDDVRFVGGPGGAGGSANGCLAGSGSGSGRGSGRSSSGRSLAGEAPNRLARKGAPMLPPTTGGAAPMWTCHKCHRDNLPAKARCGGCHSWKGGRREGYSPSKKEVSGGTGARGRGAREGREADATTANAIKDGTQAGATKAEATKASATQATAVQASSDDRGTMTPAGKTHATTAPSSSGKGGAMIPWTCDKCTHVNVKNKARCGGCQAWKGGRREGYSSPGRKGPASAAGKGKKGQASAAKKGKVSSGKGPKNVASAKGSQRKAVNDGAPSPARPSSLGKGGAAAPSGQKTPFPPSTQQRDATTTTTPSLSGKVGGAMAPWTCHKCAHANTKTKARCAECQSWKGGKREGYSPGKKGKSPATASGGAGETKNGSDEKRAGKERAASAPDDKPASTKRTRAANGGAGASSAAKRPRTETQAGTSNRKGRAAGATARRAAAGRPSKPSATSKPSAASSNGGGLGTNGTNEMNEMHHTLSSFAQRKSNLSRRPRPFKPTERMMAQMQRAETAARVPHRAQGDARVPPRARAANVRIAKGVQGRDGEGGRKRTSAGTTAADGESSGEWACHACGHNNAPARARCQKCQGWRGGKREGYAPAKVKRSGGPGGGPRQAKAGTRAVEARGHVDAATASDDRSDAEASNYDDVACCLCKCAVDFGDAYFFLPPGTNEEEEAEVAAKGGSGEGTDEQDGSALAAATATIAGVPASVPETIGFDGEKKEKHDKGSKSEGNSDDDDDDDSDDDDDDPPPFQLPRRFHNPANALVLCDGPVHAPKRGGAYRCDRAYHRQCHFVPVLSLPRGPWRCLVCRYWDEAYLQARHKGRTKKGNGRTEDEGDTLAEVEWNDIFRCWPVHPASGNGAATNDPAGEGATGSTAANGSVPPDDDEGERIAAAERKFERLAAPLKAKLLHAELTTKSTAVIKSSFAILRTAGHSLRSLTETSKARKALADRIDGMGGLPQELVQCVMRIAVAKTKVRELIGGLEDVIWCRPVPGGRSLPPQRPSNGLDGTPGYREDAVDELLRWYQQQSQTCDSATAAPEAASTSEKSLLHHLFPEGDARRRRVQPRTGEAHARPDDDEAARDDNSSDDGVSLDDLCCWSCHGTHATDDNDMLLCDGRGCYRAFHMGCLEPKLTPEDVDEAEDDDWFCPLCTAHGTLIHRAQREHLGDDWEEAMREGNEEEEEWETAADVFPEAPFELRVAQKFKDGVRDEETRRFLEETLGIASGSAASRRGHGGGANSFGMGDDEDEDEEDDDDFDQEEEMDDDDSLAKDVDEEKRLGKESIKKEELDALSVDSSAVSGSDADDGDSLSDRDSDEDSGGMGSDSNRAPVRRSKRRRFTLPGDTSGDDEDERSRSPQPDIGTLDVANIVRGKRSRKKVDYRKLADAMFGDETDEDARGAKKEYTYRPLARDSSTDNVGGESDSEE